MLKGIEGAYSRQFDDMKETELAKAQLCLFVGFLALADYCNSAFEEYFGVV